MDRNGHIYYKPYERFFNRLALPIYFEYDHTKGQFRELNNEERMIKMYGTNHADLFNIPFELFVQLDSTAQDRIYAFQSRVKQYYTNLDQTNGILMGCELSDYDGEIIVEPAYIYYERYLNASSTKEVADIKSKLQSKYHINPMPSKKPYSSDNPSGNIYVLIRRAEDSSNPEKDNKTEKKLEPQPINEVSVLESEPIL